MKVNLSLDGQPLDKVIASYHKMYDEEAAAYRIAVKAGSKEQQAKSLELLKWLDVRLQRDWEDLQFFKTVEVSPQ
jgi:hypothetical protein